MKAGKGDKSAKKSKGWSEPIDYPTVTVSREVLEETPGRALQMLMAINRSLPIRAAAERVGMTRAVRIEGWNKIQAVTGNELLSDGEDEPTVDVDVATAITTLDNSDEKLLAKVRATLQHSFPEEARMVLNGLSAKRGSASVLVVSTLLDRLDALSESERGRAALERLAQRGLTSEERAKLRMLVAKASGADASGARAKPAKPSAAPGDKTKAQDRAASEEEYLRLLRVLRAWFEEWSELLRTEITRRDHLIQLGLAERKRGVKARAATRDEVAQEA